MRHINANREAIEQVRIKTGLERQFRRKIAKTFLTIARVAYREVKKHGTVENTLATVDKRVKKMMESHYRKTIMTFAARAEGRQTKRQTRFQHIIDDYIASVGGDNIVQVTQSSKKKIRRILADGQVAGKPLPSIAREIRQVSSDYAGNRAATIARTETNSAANFAADKIDRENRGEIVDNRVKRWVSINDPRTRGHHVLMNGVQVPVDDSFEVPYRGNNYSMLYPGDPAGGAGNVINCRCIVIYIDDETSVRQDGVTTSGTEEYNRWGIGVSQDEFAYHQDSWYRNLPEDLRKVIEQADALENVIHNPNEGPSYHPVYKEISMINRPGEWDDLDEHIFNQRAWRHEFGHHIDRKPDGTHWSAAATRQMLVDSAMATDDFIAAARASAGAEMKAMAARLQGGGKLTVAEIHKQLAGTGINVRDLARMLPGIREGSSSFRLREMYGAATQIKNKNWKDLEKVLRFYDKEMGDWSSANNFIEALTDARLGDGHGLRYYHRYAPIDDTGYTEDHTGEAWAEYIALTGSRNRATWRKLLTHFAPNTINSFDDILKEMVK